MLRTSLKRGSLTFALLALMTTLSLSACSPVSATQEKAEGSEGSAVEWSLDANCLECHAFQAGSIDDATCLASVHKAAGASCTTCHTDKAALSSAHEQATAELAARATKLRKSSVDESACLTCHDDYSSLAERVQKAAELTDSSGKSVNPHSLPDGKGHEDITCTSCHAIHVQNAKATEDSKNLCLSCHHADTFECGTCHE